jgi:hypothetical protein
VYCTAKTRCNNPRCKDYPDYGGRGIEFRFVSFEEFFEHIGKRPSPKHTLDRIEVDGHYEKGNVCWATRKQQRANQRPRDRMRLAVKTLMDTANRSRFFESVLHPKRLSVS